MQMKMKSRRAPTGDRRTGAADFDHCLPSTPTSTPNEWLATKFMKVHKRFGSAVHVKETRTGERYVADISEDFFAGTLGVEGLPKTPTVFVPEEGRFYTYDPDCGLYQEQAEPALAARLSLLLL